MLSTLILAAGLPKSTFSDPQPFSWYRTGKVREEARPSRRCRAAVAQAEASSSRLRRGRVIFAVFRVHPSTGVCTRRALDERRTDRRLEHISRFARNAAYPVFPACAKSLTITEWTPSVLSLKPA